MTARPTTPPTTAPQAVGLYLRTAGRALRGVFAPGSGQALDALPVLAGRAVDSSRGFRRAEFVLSVLMLIFLAVCLWVVALGGSTLYLGPLELSVRSLRNPSKLLALTLVARLVLADLRARTWIAVRCLNALAQVRPAARAGIALWFALVISTLASVDGIVASLGIQRQRARAAGASTVFTNEWHLHMPGLIEHLARRSSAEPAALVIEDVNPRGHLDSFYAYPRLIRMRPELHAWSLLVMMTMGGERDPAFAHPGTLPPLADTRRWASKRGLELLIARPAGVEVFGASAEPLEESP
jgi:hypothetical protein